jgi:hypothetical protein
MTDESAPRGVRPVRNTPDAYPRDLAAFLAERWETHPGATGAPDSATGYPLPETPMLEEVLSVCYRASLLREEEQPVTFRLALCGPEAFPAEGGPPDGLHRLEFTDPRPFDAQELRRLSSATDYPRSIVGVGYDGERGLRIWGLVHSGPRWLRDRRGGRVTAPPLPPLPIVHVTGAGRLEVRKGSGVVARLENGALEDASMDVFETE